MDTGIDERTKRIIIGVISTLFPHARIILYGSRARGDHKERSDIDVAVDTGKKEERVNIGEARDMINESNIHLKVEVVDFNNIPKEMQQNIISDGILWKK